MKAAVLATIVLVAGLLPQAAMAQSCNTADRSVSPSQSASWPAIRYASTLQRIYKRRRIPRATRPRHLGWTQ
jgi:hypothetical protein